MKALILFFGIFFVFNLSISLKQSFSEEIPNIGKLLEIAKELKIEDNVIKSISYDEQKKRVAGVTIEGRFGYYPYSIAKDFTNSSYTELLKANNLTEEDAAKLPARYQLFIPWDLLREEFRNPLPKLINAKAEIAKLRSDLQEERSLRSELESLLVKLKSLLSKTKEENTTLKESLEQEKRLTAQLIKTSDLKQDPWIVKQANGLTKMAANNKFITALLIVTLCVITLFLLSKNDKGTPLINTRPNQA